MLEGSAYDKVIQGNRMILQIWGGSSGRSQEDILGKEIFPIGDKSWVCGD